jgi:hypothetical protein
LRTRVSSIRLVSTGLPRNSAGGHESDNAVSLWNLPQRPWFRLSEFAGVLGIDPSTAWRWANQGVHGQRLRTAWLGGRRVVMLADAQAFLAALNRSDSPSDPGQSAEVHAQIIDTELDALGL